jgi:hypothetical protein
MTEQPNPQTLIDQQLIAQCTICGAQRKTKPNKLGGTKCPRGWKLLPTGLSCGDCKKNAYYMRGFRIEIRGLADDEERDVKEFYRALSAAASASARYGNWIVQRLYALDAAAAPTLEKTKDGKTKLPPCPAFDYYRAAADAFPELARGCIPTLYQMVRGWYSARRFDSLVCLNRSIESYRFGYLPVEVRKQDWSLKCDAEGKFSIKCAIAPGKSWHVKVYGGKINLTRLRQIASGTSIPLACKIIRGSKVGANGEPRKAWFFRISAMFPRVVRRQSHQEITLTLGHDAGCLLFGILEGSDEVFEFPGDTLRKMIVGGDKSDKRHQIENSLQRGIWPKRKQARWGRDRTARCASRQRKIKKQIELVAAALARWCRAHGVTSVDYEITDRGFICHFPWRTLRDDIGNALEREGIALAVVDNTVQEEAA